MWYTPLTVGLLLLAPLDGAMPQLTDAMNLQACIVENQLVMGSTMAEAYCARLRDEARARQQAAAASPIERAYQDCLILNRRTMGSLAENYCTQRREEAMARLEVSMFPTP